MSDLEWMLFETKTTNTVFFVIVKFDTFGCHFGIISYGNVLVANAKNNDIFLSLALMNICCYITGFIVCGGVKWRFHMLQH